MECTACSWTQLWIGIVIGAVFSFIATFIGILLIKYPLKPKLEQRFDRNELNVNIGIMGWVNSFDSTFKFFFEMFEHHFGLIRELREEEWLPNPYQTPTTNETGGLDLHVKPEPEYSKALEARARLEYLDKEIFGNYVEDMKSTAKTIVEYMNKNELYLDPMFKRVIEQYLNWTIFYVVHLKSGWNYTGTLQKRFDHANQIIEILKKNKLENKPHISDFIEKWENPT